MYCKKLLIAPLLLGFGAVTMQADSISPASYTTTLDKGESVTIRKVVTVGTEAPTTTKVDVYFLADTTGSMGEAIWSVRTSAATILNTVAGLGDVQFAVGSYRDFPRSPYGSPGDYSYQLEQSMTANQPLVQNGINTWDAGGGNDGPEAQLAACEALSQSAAAAVGWRGSSEKILVWFGDAPGHDSALEPSYPGPTEAAATAALVSKGIQVLALDVGSMDAYGQASRITAATGGTLYNGIASSEVAAAISAAIQSAYDTYSTVALDVSGVPAGVDVEVTPLSITGDYDRSVERTFAFDVTFTGLTSGTYSFNIDALVDGGTVASETDRITVSGGGSDVPDGGSSILLLGAAMGGLVIMRRRR